MLSAFSSKASISDGMGVHKCIQYGELVCFGRHYELGGVTIHRYIDTMYDDTSMPRVKYQYLS